MANRIRKCGVCGQNIDTEKPEENFFIDRLSKANKCYHCECFIQYKTNLKKPHNKTEEECKQYIEECRAIPITPITTGHVVKKKAKHIRFQLYDFIIDMYGTTFLPKYFFSRMDSVFKGEYTGLTQPVPPEDLLDMWQQKKNYLNKVYENNKAKGKEIEGISRIFYDLSILLGKYDSYLEWKEKQRIASEDGKVEKENIIEYSELKRSPQTTGEASKKDCIDISDMLDDI